MTSGLEDRLLTESYWPIDDSVPLSEHTLGSLLQERAQQFPDTVAVIANAHGTGQERRLTYQELYDEAQRVAAAILELVEPGDYVALWAPNIVEWPIILFGAAIAGVTLVALNPVLRRDELMYALGHSRATLLIHADVSRAYDMVSVAAEAKSQ